jgi:ELWxxDGT repeat protein
VLFNGFDAAGKQGLWVTDGTTAGTHEITGISGANSNGLAPADLTVLPGAVTAGSDGTAHKMPDGGTGNGVLGAAPVTRLPAPTPQTRSFLHQTLGRARQVMCLRMTAARCPSPTSISGIQEAAPMVALLART